MHLLPQPSSICTHHITGAKPKARRTSVVSPHPIAWPHPRRGGALRLLLCGQSSDAHEIEWSVFWKGCLFSSIACWACCRLWAFWWQSYYRKTQGIGMLHVFCLVAEALVGYVDSVLWIANIVYYICFRTPHSKVE